MGGIELHRGGIIPGQVGGKHQLRLTPWAFQAGGGHGRQRPGEIVVGVAEHQGQIILFSGKHGSGVHSAITSQQSLKIPVGKDGAFQPVKGTSGTLRPGQGGAGVREIVSGSIDQIPAVVVISIVVGKPILFGFGIIKKHRVRMAVGRHVLALVYKSLLKGISQTFPALPLVHRTVDQKVGKRFSFFPYIPIGVHSRVIVPAAVEIAEQ